MILQIVTAISVISLALALIIIALISKKLKYSNATIAGMQKNEIEIQSKVENIKDEIRLITNLYMASDTLINITDDNDIYTEIFNKMEEFFKCKQAFLYSFDDEKRIFVKKFAMPEQSNLPSVIDFGDMKVNDVSNEREMSYMVRSSKQRPLYYIRIEGKRNNLDKNLVDGVFTDTDLKIMDIYLKQSAMVLEKIKAYKKMERMALTDNLTGLYNRHYAHEIIKKEIKRANRHQYPVSVVFFDIDKFKKVNDTFGHDVGDLALRHIADITRKTTREYDIAIRWGGEEFILFLPNTASDGAYALAERLRIMVQETHFEYCPLTISLGLSTYPGDSVNIEKVINNADSAVYYSKQTGRNKVTIYKDVENLLK